MKNLEIGDHFRYADEDEDEVRNVWIVGDNPYLNNDNIWTVKVKEKE